MKKSAILVTGANGEMGHGLIQRLQQNTFNTIISLDLQKPDITIKHLIFKSFIGNILDDKILKKISDEFKIYEIYHLAALLSTKAESEPMLAHNVNVGGTIKLLNMAIEQSKLYNKTIKFFFPSSIAVYGLNGIINKEKAGTIREEEFCYPETMYGCNKLSCEHLGRYYSLYYNKINLEKLPNLIDFRSIRFPGLISAFTLPTGGTTDYAPEMLHAAANNSSYTCFVNKNTQLPFMLMIDAIDAIIQLMKTDKIYLNKLVYNISSFSVTALDFKNIICDHFPNTSILFKVNNKRQSMVDSWPVNVDSSAAKNDWNFHAKYNFKKSFQEYLIPEIRKQYE